MEVVYIVELEGDYDWRKSWPDGKMWPLKSSFPSLEAALKWIEDGPAGAFDPEDDRILVWEALPTGHMKVVWHASGWHWPSGECDDLDQGKLLGHEESLYEEAFE